MQNVMRYMDEQRNREPGWFWHYLALAILYVLATRFTDPEFMADTYIYVLDVLKAANGETGMFWEFGHVIWRPLSWLVYLIVRPVVNHLAGGDAHTGVLITLIGLSWLAGLLSVLLVYAIAARFCKTIWVRYVCAIALLFSNAFLNYCQTGQPYVPGLSMLFLAVYLLTRNEQTPRRQLVQGILAGIALTLSGGFWLPYVMSVPAALAVPILVFRPLKPQVRLALVSAITLGVLLSSCYVVAILSLRLYTLAEIHHWSTYNSGHFEGMRGLPRMVFSFARSLVNMGNDGRLFKRYLLKDPFNPVSLLDLFRLSFWKLAIFYLFLLAMLVKLALSDIGRKAIAILILAAVPMVIFALFLFEAGSTDRYLPLYPFILLSLAIALCDKRIFNLGRWIMLAFVAILVFSNVTALSSMVLHRKESSASARIESLLPLLKPATRVVTVQQQDDVYSFNQNFLFNPINRSGKLETDLIVDPGTVQIRRWRQIFASKSLHAWEKGGDVWVSRRVLSQRPRPEWEWVEGDDPRVSWTDIYQFFSQFEMGQTVGGDDGFMLLTRSDRNEQILKSVSAEN